MDVIGEENTITLNSKTNSNNIDSSDGQDTNSLLLSKETDDQKN